MGIGGPLNHYESLISLKIVDQIGGSIVWFHPRHLESRWDWLIQDVSTKQLGDVEVIVVGGLLTFHLKLSKLANDLLKFTFIIIKSPLENSRG